MFHLDIRGALKLHSSAKEKKNPSHATGRVPGVRKPGLPGSRKLSEIGEVWSSL